MPFRHLIGHQQVTGLLARAVCRRSLPPSLIFAGSEGVGKHAAAVALAQALNCLDPLDGAQGDGLAIDACGACSACDRIARLTHPDIVAIAPGETGTIKIEVVREAIERTAYRPFEGRRRVVIIDRADALVPAAQSALLKTLEEPPASSIFVLVTSRPDVLLPTVRSRCPRIRFGRLAASEIAGALVGRHGYSESDARAVASTAGGSLGRALAEALDELGEARHSARTLLAVAGRERAPKPLLAGAAEFAKGKGGRAGAGRELLGRRLRALASLVRDLQVCASRGGRELVVNRDLADELEDLTDVFDQPRITRGFAAVVRALQALDRNASPKVVADWVALQL